MKQYILIFSLLLSTNLYSQPKMKSIDEIMNNEYSPATVIFANQRCSAMYLTASSLVQDRNDMQHLASDYEDKAKFMATMALFFSANNKDVQPITPETNNAQISKIYDAYIADGNEARALTGNFTDGVMQYDMTSCAAMYDMFSENLDKKISN